MMMLFDHDICIDLEMYDLYPLRLMRLYICMPIVVFDETQRLFLEYLLYSRVLSLK
jgi:hypothetical protein